MKVMCKKCLPKWNLIPKIMSMQKTAWQQHLLDSQTLMDDQVVIFGWKYQSLSRYLCQDSSLLPSYLWK